LNVSDSPSASHDVTQLLVAWGDGDPTARETLLPLIYDALHHLARLHAWRVPQPYPPANFFAASAQSMRHILVDRARGRNRQRRGGNIPHLSLDEGIVFLPQRASEVVSLDEALTALAKLDERKSRVVELRFFGGLSTRETAEVLKVSEATVEREWKRAKAWLSCELEKANTVNHKRQFVGAWAPPA